MIALRHYIGWHILRNARATADHDMSTNRTELVNRAQATDDRMFIYRDVACECRVISQNTVVSNDAIVRNVGVDHKKVVAADLCDPTALDSPAMDRDTLTYFVAISYLDESRLSGVLQVLVVFSDRGERIDYVVSANAGVPAYDDVRPEYGAITNLHIAANAAIRANADASADDSAFFNNCGRMDDSRFIDHKYSLAEMPRFGLVVQFEWNSSKLQFAFRANYTSLRSRPPPTFQLAIVA